MSTAAQHLQRTNQMATYENDHGESGYNVRRPRH